MKKCGSNRWWLDDAKLVIRRQRRLPDVLKGLGILALSAGMAWLMRLEVNLEFVVYGLAGVSFGLYYTLGAWEVTLHRVSQRASWRWGLGVPLFTRNRVVADTDRVQLVTSKGTSSDWRPHTYSIHLTGVSKSETLAGSDDYDEALELAEAVARHMRRGLQVDDGRVRSFESERVARLRGFEADSALASTRASTPPGASPCRDRDWSWKASELGSTRRHGGQRGSSRTSTCASGREACFV
ncbi:hypothetical protein F0U60_28690 [Archangium minus]|uniref:DUF304 domain-containing protein n=1 Tax=Archangium minus TaxID=83450 RepID=A0ABY9WX17_9BACT|nr:hypothetical protein F0U60_28690 [Archangium minus]